MSQPGMRPEMSCPRQITATMFAGVSSARSSHGRPRTTTRSGAKPGATRPSEPPIPMAAAAEGDEVVDQQGRRYRDLPGGQHADLVERHAGGVLDRVRTLLEGEVDALRCVAVGGDEHAERVRLVDGGADLGPRVVAPP